MSGLFSITAMIRVKVQIGNRGWLPQFRVVIIAIYLQTNAHLTRRILDRFVEVIVLQAFKFKL
ncbi:MAG TPA: hypothetical protein DEP88_00410 [Verrucomicrobiales bacterium]|nr:hypothetical protein [Verrucomicrobiales bacterium]HCL97446.1 hypothetical protein [Verrucomicrobiales bacterium]